jgi:hypothetical protein
MRRVQVRFAAVVAAVVVSSGIVAVGVSSGGVEAASSPPTAPGTYVSLKPARILDTRSQLGATAPGSRATVTLAVAGHGGVPATGASAVVMNLTVTQPTSSGYLTAWASGAAQPTASNLNFAKGKTVANLAVIPVGVDGKINIYNRAGVSQVIGDVAGYYLAGSPVASAGAFVATNPSRILDTRSKLGASAPGNAATVKLTVAGHGGVPSTGVSAVVMNLTVTKPTGNGYLTAWADGAARPTASNVNFTKGTTVANLAVIPVGANGKIDLFNFSGVSQVIGDVAGYIVAGTPTASGSLKAVAPSRIVDTRRKLGASAPGTNVAITVTVAGHGGVPAGAAAVVLNLTVTKPTAAGYLTAWADGTPQPTASNVNFAKGDTVANLAIVPIGADGKIKIFNYSGVSQVIADVAGYIVAAPAPPSVTNVFIYPDTTTAALSWANPAGSTGTLIRRMTGSVAPATPTSGASVANLGTNVRTFRDTGMNNGVEYSYSFFSHNAKGFYSTPTVARTLALKNSVPDSVQPRTSATVTETALPTAQIDGVAYAQVIVGNKVYVGGNFGKARPATKPLGDPTEVTRTYLLAYDLTTGVLDPNFAPVLNGQVKALAVSPNGKTLYVGGNFLTVNGASHARLAAFNLATAALSPPLIPTFTASATGQVNALVATNTALYAGGIFGNANGLGRSKLAAFTSAGALTTWKPTADLDVNALVFGPGQKTIIVGGKFTTLNSTTVYGLGAVDATTGTTQPWAANQLVRDWGPKAGITNLSTDGNSVLGTGFNFGGANPGHYLEGAFSANAATGAINWIEDCHGDSYGVFPTNGFVYVVSHAHFCANDGGFGSTVPETFQHSMAFSLSATGKLAHNSQGQGGTEYTDYFGVNAPSIIDWAPTFTIGTKTGQNQAAWTVTGNSTYLLEGGEFPTVNGVGQQGLVRFKVP